MKNEMLTLFCDPVIVLSKVNKPLEVNLHPLIGVYYFRSGPLKIE